MTSDLMALGATLALAMAQLTASSILSLRSFGKAHLDDKWFQFRFDAP